MENTYWNSTGKYQNEYNELVELVPPMGKCGTTAGEILRAATRLYYDFHNNGMGNNTSGAANFLLEKGVYNDNRKVYDTVYEYTRGKIYDGWYKGDALHLAIEKTMDLAIATILADPELKSTTNTDDMFDYEDEEQHFCEECGIEITSSNDSGSGWICSDCYEEQMAREEEEWA